MFLSKKKVEGPESPRNELAAAALAHGSPGQRLFGVICAVTTAIVMLSAVVYFYVWPQLQQKEAKSDEPDVPANTPKAESASLVVPLDLDTAADAQDAEYKPIGAQPGDARPSPSPGTSKGDGKAQKIGSTKSLPPGMEGETPGIAGGSAGEHHEQSNGQESPASLARKRKLEGDLGDFGESPVRRTAMPSSTTANAYQAQLDPACTGIDDPDVAAECSRRVAAVRPKSQSGSVMPSIPISPLAAQAAGGNDLAGQLVAIQTPNGEVGVVPNPHLTMRKGVPVTCTLDTAIQTDQVGFVECTTDFPIYSMDGKVVLAERGTVISGEYKRGVQEGTNTIFVLWTKAVTPAPYHVTFELLSPGSDRLGRAGISGEVDNKYWQRYSGPLLFSVLQDVGTVAVNRASSSGNGNVVVVPPNTQNTGKSAVEELLKQGANVKPSLYRNQGDTISITVARYIDFSNVYKLRAARSRKNG